MKDHHENNFEERVFTHVVSIPVPPPPGFLSEFDTIHDWLLSICKGNEPDKAIDTYSFGLFKSVKNGYTLCLTGENTYKEGENHSSTLVEFKPLDMFFKLPESDYDNLNQEQVLHKLATELTDFVYTAQFKTSFFAKANVIRFSTNGQIIWSKNGVKY